MIYRNRAGRAAAAIIGGWVMLRFVLLWSAHDRSAVTKDPLKSIASPAMMRNSGARLAPVPIPSAALRMVRQHGLAEANQLTRGSPPRASMPPAMTIATARTPYRYDAAPLSSIAADDRDQPNFPKVLDTALQVPASKAAPPAFLRTPARNHSSRAPPLALSAWSIVRPSGNARTLATNGALGASQAGLRARLDLIEPSAGIVVAANFRLTSPLHSASGREAGAGISLRPVRAIPVELIAETRIALDASIRDRMAILIAGGVSDKSVPFGLRLNAYGQAGFVGLRHRDAFVDGAAIVERPLGNARTDGRHAISLGVAVAGGAQPGAARLDIGPELSRKQPLAHGGLRLAGGYRWRVAGRARPGSGPVLTIGVNF